MVQNLYIVLLLNSFCFCQGAEDFLSAPSSVVRNLSKAQDEAPPLPHIALHYLPNESTFMSDCAIKHAVQLIDAALIAVILQKIYFPSLLQANFSLQVEKVKTVLIDEIGAAKDKHAEFKEIIEITEKRFCKKGYIPYLLQQVQRKVSAEIKVIVSGQVMTEYDCLLFIANHFSGKDISLTPDKTIFFCHLYQDRMQPAPSDDEIQDIQYLKETVLFTAGKRPSDYVPGILKGIKRDLQFYRNNIEAEYISEYERQAKRFENKKYLENLILKIQR